MNTNLMFTAIYYMEQQFLAWLETRLKVQSDSIVGIGDDCAVIPDPLDSSHVVSTDAIVDQVHFDASRHSPSLIGRKALAVNLSDIAAMGAIPDYAVVSLIIPLHWSLAQVQDLYTGLLQLATEFNTEIIGGDFNRHEGPLIVSVTIMGHQLSSTIKYRKTASVGDNIYVTGPLGGSILEHHVQFTPRIDMGLELASHASVHAMTDITDGLVIDLHSMLNVKQGALLFADSIPVRTEIQGDPDALQRALYDGEDFELLFTASPQFTPSRSTLKSNQEIYKIGLIQPGGGISLQDSSTTITKLSLHGYEH